MDELRKTMRLFIVLLALLCAASACVTALGAERFPPPDFDESGHTLPVTQKPSAREEAYEYRDMRVLMAALILATYLVLRKRSRRWIVVLTVFSLAYFGFWRKGCICPIGAIQNVVLTIFDRTYVLPVTVIVFFSLPLLFALFFGRVFCSSVCPLGAIQDVVLLRPVQVPRWLEHTLRPLAYIYLGAAVLLAAMGSMFIICRYDPFIGIFRLSGSLGMLVLGGVFLLTGVFVGRPYCRFLCPYGAVLGLVSRLSKWRATITPDRCVQCRLCEGSCPFGASEKPAEKLLPGGREEGRKRLGLLLALLPVLVVLGVWIGGGVGGPLSRTHTTVQLAERVRQEDAGQFAEYSDASRAFRDTGRPVEELYDDSRAIRRRFVVGGYYLGAWIGLVIACKLISLSVFRKRTDHEPDRARCLACGRCFEYCPIEKRRLKEQGPAESIQR